MSLLSKNKRNPSPPMRFRILYPGLWDSSGFDPIFCGPVDQRQWLRRRGRIANNIPDDVSGGRYSSGRRGAAVDHFESISVEHGASRIAPLRRDHHGSDLVTVQAKFDSAGVAPFSASPPARWCLPGLPEASSRG